MVTIHPVMLDDFCDYGRLMRGLYWVLSGQVKKNHNFSCNDGGVQMMLWESNLKEHKEDFVQSSKEENMGRYDA